MKKMLAHFVKRWYVYLAFALTVVFIWCFVLDMVTAPTADEKISVFLSCYTYDEELTMQLKERKPDGIRAITVGAFNQDNAFYGAYFNADGSVADIVTLSQRFADMCQCDSYFISVDAEAFISRYPEAEFFFYQGVAYGVKIYDSATGRGRAERYVGYTDGEQTEDYYLFFNKNSSHLGFLSQNSIDEAALLILDYLWTL